MNTSRHVLFTALLIFLLLSLTSCTQSKTLSPNQYDIVKNPSQGDQTTFFVAISSDLVEDGVQTITVKIKYTNHLGKTKTDTFTANVDHFRRAYFSIDDTVTEYQCKKVVAGYGEEPVDVRPSIFMTILYGLLAAVGSFIVYFIPASFFTFFFESMESLAACSTIPFLIFVIYAFASWGLLRGIIMAVIYLVYGGLLLKLADDIW